MITAQMGTETFTLCIILYLILNAGTLLVFAKMCYLSIKYFYYYSKTLF